MVRWIAVFFAALSVGCTSPATMSVTLKETWEKIKRRPNRLIVSASPNYIEKDGFPFHQGLFVRAHFFINDDPITMQADGEMTFTVYDKAKNGETPTPVGLYRISNEDMPKHLRKDIVGDSYVFWLPYEPETPTQMVVNASFRPPYGDPYTAEPSIVHLTPLKSAVAAASAAEMKKSPRPNYVGFNSQAPKERAVVSTIPLGRPTEGTTTIQTFGGPKPLNGAAPIQAVSTHTPKEPLGVPTAN